MRASRLIFAALTALAAAPIVLAEEPFAMQPTDEHKELGAWIGNWSGLGELKPGPFGPGGPMIWTEECSWFEGSPFHVVCRSNGTSPTGPMKGLGIVGYNAEKKVFTHYGVDSTGWSGYSEGTKNGNVWVFKSEETMGGKKYHTRFSMTVATPTTMTFSWEMSEDGKLWTVLMDGTSEKR